MEYDEKVRFLRRYKEALDEEQLIADQIGQLQAEAQRMTPVLSGMPGGGGNTDKIPKAVERILDAQHQLTEQMYRTQEIRREILQAIDTLHNARARELLRRRYILSQRWEEIACTMNLDYRWTTRLHHRFVEALEIGGER